MAKKPVADAASPKTGGSSPAPPPPPPLPEKQKLDEITALVKSVEDIIKLSTDPGSVAYQQRALSELRKQLGVARTAWATADPATCRKRLQQQRDTVESKLKRNRDLQTAAQKELDKVTVFVVSQSKRLADLDAQLRDMPATVAAAPVDVEADLLRRLEAVRARKMAPVALAILPPAAEASGTPAGPPQDDGDGEPKRFRSSVTDSEMAKEEKREASVSAALPPGPSDIAKAEGGVDRAKAPY